MKKILIVDDRFCAISNPLIRTIANFTQEEINIDFITVSTKAIEMLKERKYDLVLMDGEFDNCALQGPEAVKMIREFSNIPILMISGLPSVIEEGIANGANGWLNKYDILEDLKHKKSKIKKLLV